jgi:uncharacterized ferritin-like protein (DUF455 family)
VNAAFPSKFAGSHELWGDPAREPCFTIAATEADMVEFDDFSTPEGRRERIHRHMNNEIGAIEIAAQCLVDFPDAPWELQMQLARQAADESRHVEGLYRRLLELGGHKGEFPIFNFEWCVTNTRPTLAGRLTIQNRTFEAGQMDLLGTLRKLWRDVGDERTAELLESILADEVNHVRFANRWIKKMAQENGRVLLEVAMAVRFLAEVNAVGYTTSAAEKQAATTVQHARMGTNVDDRRNAEFTDDEIATVLRQSGMNSFLSISHAVAPDA